MQNINISKIAFGSLSTSIGDNTLGYSSGVSYRAREVDGIYVDNPPVLSKNYSSVIWQYCQDTDKYMFTHVQGLHVVDEGMGRFFPYRGAYEVSREEMNRTGLKVASVMDAMPRIKQYTAKETWNESSALHPHTKKGDAYTAECLAEVIERVLDVRSHIYIGMKTAGRNLRCNGVFDTEEWNTLIEAIDLLGEDVRRYVSFAFCVDKHYEDKLDDVLVVVYAQEEGITVPKGCTNISWDALKSLKRCLGGELNDIRRIMSMLPGKKEKLLSFKEMMHAIQVQKDKPRFEAQLMKEAGDLTSGAAVAKLLGAYKGKVDDSALVKKVSMLDAVKHKVAIDELLNDEKRDKIVTQGLELLFINKAKSLGTNAEAWLKFLEGLTADGAIMERSFKMYMSRVRTWTKKDIAELCKSVVAYSKAHPRKAKSEAFRLMVKTLNLEKEIKIKNEPKNPSNKMQDKETRTNIVADNGEYDSSSFEEIYKDIIKEEKANKKKKQVITAVCSFLLGAAVVGGAWFATSNMQAPEPVAPEPVVVVPDTINPELTDSLASIADSLQTNPDSVAPVKKDSAKVVEQKADKVVKKQTKKVVKK